MCVRIYLFNIFPPSKNLPKQTQENKIEGTTAIIEIRIVFV